MTSLVHLAVSKFGVKLDDALYETPAATLMLLLYQEAWINDRKIITLEEIEEINDRKERNEWPTRQST